MLVLFTGFLQLLPRVLHVPLLNPMKFAGLLKNLAEMGTMYNGPSSFSSAVPPDDGPKDLRNSQWNAAQLPSAFSCAYVDNQMTAKFLPSYGGRLGVG